MPNITSRSRVITRGKKRLVAWDICSVPTGVSNLAAATKAIAVRVPSSTMQDIAPGTIVRTHGKLLITTDQTAASEEQIGAIGFGFMNDVAGALGVTGLPGPASECAWGGWFLHQFFSQGFKFGTAVAFINNGVEYVLESKGMRKFGADEEMIVVIENFHATTSFNFALSFRMLVKAG